MKEEVSNLGGSSLEDRLVGEGVAEIPVRISYEIIRLFSEGLYQSPHKAIEELVTNSWDAGATRARVLVPSQEATEALWVIDNGTGMDEAGFHALWSVADSRKYEASEIAGRLPIGQFGIGKLAAYVLAWRITHVSKSAGHYRYTTLNFRDVTGHQYEPHDPVVVSLHEVSEEQAQELLAEVEARDPAAWSMLFGKRAAKSWTAAALSDFKDLFGKLKEGTLGWVLSTGLPLAADFAIFLNGDKLVSSKEKARVVYQSSLGGANDEAAAELELETTSTGVLIPGLEGEISGQARLFERKITGGKSDQYERSNGFFIRVRRRVINLEDALFGLDTLNHAAWARFAMEVDADGLREHLLSSREGVRESPPVSLLRKYLLHKFNECRRVYEKEARGELVELDIEQLLSDAPHSLVVDPLLELVESSDPGVRDRYYIQPLGEPLDPGAMGDLAESIRERPFAEIDIDDGDPYERLTSYDPATQSLTVNVAHPFVSKIAAHSKNQTPIALVASAEVVTDALLGHLGLPAAQSLEFLETRDRVLRMLAGDYGPDAAEVLRQLAVANQDKDAMERAVGEAFDVLGLKYERRGGNKDGPDGVLDAKLGRFGTGMADYRVVFDAKTTDKSAVPADKVDFGALERFRQEERADHSFVSAKQFAGQGDVTSAVNRELSQELQVGRNVSLITTPQLMRLVRLHYAYGVTLTQLADLFETAHFVSEVDDWLNALESDLAAPDGRVPLRRLLEALEQAKADPKSAPNVHAVRATTPPLQQFEPERLIAVLGAVQTLLGPKWLDVSAGSGDVRMHASAGSIASELERLAEAMDLT